ncbi:ABC transporter substrate-binding protein [Corynebacterium auriscanis]|uniref:ABC transporter substrate-binding protein n=1 Tax=Corynebacterium auriscanis TaxID=99807 RepID=UPI002247F26F|nr:ABC transporter substrate-binding protein [Corynebacterium auriscanis]MCX2162655.1 ABC transporter substrate-binding protein [Corynebacterium auriscanis]
MTLFSASSSPRPLVRLVTQIVATTVTVFVLASCATNDDLRAQQSGHVVQNCGVDVSVPDNPQRVVTLGAESITTLHELGVLDRVVARAGEYPRDYFDEPTWNEVEKIPSLTDRLNSTGHIQLSIESALAQKPDLVIGSTETITRQALQPHNVAQLNEAAFCGAFNRPANWNDVWEHVDTYATAFNRQAEGREYVQQLKRRLAENRTAPRGQKVLITYPSIGGGPMYAYGNHSMSNAVVEAAGLENVFANEDQRVFEVNPEQVAAKNPDVIIALYTAGDPVQVKNAVSNYEGTKNSRATREGRVLPLLLNYAEPPTPLALKGVEKIREFTSPAVNATELSVTKKASREQTHG